MSVVSSKTLTIKNQIAGVDEREIPLKKKHHLDDVPPGFPDVLNLQAEGEKIIPDKKSAGSHWARRSVECTIPCHPENLTIHTVDVLYEGGTAG